MQRTSLIGWRRVELDGGVMLMPPSGSGLIRMTTRAPLRPLRVIVDELVGLGLGGRTVAQVGARAIVTEEGEHAALVTLRTTHGEPPLERHVGLVFGDEHVAIIDGRVAAPDEFAIYAELVERITASWCMGLGAERWRRYYYRPPARWSGLRRYQGDLWLPPDYPRTLASITVFHARPERSTRPAQQHGRLFENLTADYRARGGSAAGPIRAHSGLVGEIALFEADGPPRRHAANVGFGDGRYLYLLRVECDDAARDFATDAFRAIYESVEPVPRPTGDLSALVHWSE